MVELVAIAVGLAEVGAEYLATLKEQMTEETKKGNLDAAVAVRAKLNRVEAQAWEAETIIKKLTGTTWNASTGGSFTWGDDGTLYHAGRERPGLPPDARCAVVAVASGRIAIPEFDERFTKSDQFSTKAGDKPVATGTRAAK